MGWTREPGYRTLKTYPGSRDQKSTGSRIRIRSTATIVQFCNVLPYGLTTCSCTVSVHIQLHIHVSPSHQSYFGNHFEKFNIAGRKSHKTFFSKIVPLFISDGSAYGSFLVWCFGTGTLCLEYGVVG